MLHADHFDEARSRFIFELHEATGKVSTLKFPVVPEALHAGMRVVVRGRVAADETGIDPDGRRVNSFTVPYTRSD